MKKFILFLCCLALVSCSTRQPGPQTAKDIITRYFEKYGDKYKNTPFYKNKVKEIKIVKMDELQKNLVLTRAEIMLEHGEQFLISMNMLFKLPFGWRQQGWENLTPGNSTPLPEESLPPTDDFSPDETPPPSKKK